MKSILIYSVQQDVIFTKTILIPVLLQKTTKHHKLSFIQIFALRLCGLTLSDPKQIRQ